MPTQSHQRDVVNHLRAVQELVSPLPGRTVAVGGADPRRVIADAARALRAVPPADVSAVDGYVARVRDLAVGACLPVAGDIPAGHPPVEIPAGAAVRIMTGAVVPACDDDVAVVPVEDTDAPRVELPARVTVTALDAGRTHIRHAGEHLRAGDVAVPAGLPLDAGTLATLVSCGVEAVTARPVPRVCVLTTGDETAPDARHERWRIPDSNGPMLTRLISDFGAEVTAAHCRDDTAALAGLLDEAAAGSDLVVTAGGISAGAFDVVKALGHAATADGRARMDFYPLAMHPGKPQGAGLWGDTPVVCLPGNPVAAWTSAVLFVAPSVRRLAGLPAAGAIEELPQVALPLDGELTPRHGGVSAAPVRLDWAAGVARMSAARGSHMVGALAGADGLAVTRPNAPTVVLRAR